ncbi:MAG TPA: oxidoreductase, partial [Burkholderiaceae bacterium]
TDEQVERLQAYYSREGCAAELVGEAMVRAARSGQSLLLIGPFAKLVFHLRRISLGLARRVMLADARKVGYL